jgi:3-phytase
MPSLFYERDLLKEMKVASTFVLAALCLSCQTEKAPSVAASNNLYDTVAAIKPVGVTDTVLNDTDDPAIWINKNNPAESLILGTDKGGDASKGGLYAFDLNGKEISSKRVANLDRPNNVDVAYGLLLNGVPVDIAVCTERNTNSIRVFSLPALTPIDSGGIPVFEGESFRAPMGIALYTAPDRQIYALVGRKTGPKDNYIWQYKIEDNGRGGVKGTLVRKFGAFSGNKEIEAIAVDNELGYVYYSDEGIGVRKYYAHPDSISSELALFATTGFSADHEGISIYKTNSTHGYIIVSDQGANKFWLFPREGTSASPHQHPALRIVRASTQESDGSDVVNYALPGFPSGLFVAMSDDKTFQIYRWEDIAGKDLSSSRISTVP